MGSSHVSACQSGRINEKAEYTNLSFSINLMKSLLGGLGMRLRQLHSESSSDPNPLYGGISLLLLEAGSTLYVIELNSSVDGNRVNMNAY